jgi:hypothetical protein
MSRPIVFLLISNLFSYYIGNMVGLTHMEWWVAVILVSMIIMCVLAWYGVTRNESWKEITDSTAAKSR